MRQLIKYYPMIIIFSLLFLLTGCIDITLQYYDFILAIASDGTGTGHIDYDSTPGGSYSKDTSITAGASADSSSLFAGWYSEADGGILISTDNPHTFKLLADTRLYAKFVLKAGYQTNYTINGVEFSMNYCPGGTFPTGVADTGESTVSYFYIAEKEVTYALWSVVHTWALAHGYSFAHAGAQGDGTGDTDQHPVTGINWRDAMVWTNALTEYYNAENNENLECVYQAGGSPIRVSNDANSLQCDEVIPLAGAKGFRLPSHPEWECAARWQGDDSSFGAIEKGGNYWTPGNYASGASDTIANEAATSAVAWYVVNAGSSTHVTGQKPSGGNALQLYDMSGNVLEWTFTAAGTTRIFLAGGWVHAATYLQVGGYSNNTPDVVGSYLGLRVVRNP